MALECELVSYDKSTGRLIGKIKNISIDDSVLTPDDKVDVGKLAPIVFDAINKTYLKIDDRVVGQAFRDGARLQ